MATMGLIYFYMLAALSIAGAGVVITTKNPIRGAMGLLLTILSVAGLFLALHAEFLAVIQLIVYAGAIVVLFLFVIMLLGPSATSARDHRGQIARTVGGGLFGLVAAGAMVAAFKSWNGSALGRIDDDFGSVDAFGRWLFSTGIVPFELSSGLLMVAVIGAVAVARGRQGEHGLTPSERAVNANAPVAGVSADLDTERHGHTHPSPEAAE
jgi:NADH-quinone oxidoreductase subunit J